MSGPLINVIGINKKIPLTVFGFGAPSIKLFTVKHIVFVPSTFLPFRS